MTPMDKSMDADAIDEFFRIFGDADGDGLVYYADYVLFCGAIGKAVGAQGGLACLDYDGNGLIDAADYSHFTANFSR